MDQTTNIPIRIKHPYVKGPGHNSVNSRFSVIRTVIEVKDKTRTTEEHTDKDLHSPCIVDLHSP